MFFSYDYSLANDFNVQLSNFKFKNEINNNPLIPEIRNMKRNGDTLTIYFPQELSATEKAELDSVVSNHTFLDLENIGDNLSNLNSNTEPTVNDDETKNYAIGSMWFDQINERSFICFGATATNANWQVFSEPRSIILTPNESIVNSKSYFVVSYFLYKGSHAIGSISSCEIISKKDGSVNSYNVRLVNYNNADILSTKTGLTNNNFEKINLGSVTNIPTAETILELQMKIDANGNTNNKFSYIKQIIINLE